LTWSVIKFYLDFVISTYNCVNRSNAELKYDAQLTQLIQIEINQSNYHDLGSCYYSE